MPSEVPTGIDADGVDSLCVRVLLGWAALYREPGVCSLVGVSWG